ncbi:Na/Pi cotransporter family protein [Bacillus sp. V3B]|uniref:Na/Pi cotransporter family protein n=1 Tax=Bacillus sp. V3B TaxID=2804915 RepID=UPI002108E07E|nr:Na/Pi cotransporter family protein [Bacillus sp. V3B]MCQ6274936.1 Na/Pi cotransporter family protein [Bacillus sp. V3B]
MEINVQQVIFELLGGLGIFLYGIRTTEVGLQRFAGNKLKDILDRFTTNPYIGVLAGIFVTGLIQSSTATTVITVGLVSAGFMTLRQAIGVIMGANIGTIVTSFIIGIDVGEYALLIIAVGAGLAFFFKNKTVYEVGKIIFGLGSLFYGLDLMTSGIIPISTIEIYQTLTVNLSSIPLLGVLIGIVSTALIHSSSATIGILQGLYATNIISLEAAVPILLGDNIGTTITAVLVSIGTSIAAKRAAAAHMLINVIGMVIFMIVLKPFVDLILWIQSIMHLNSEMTIAFAHIIFNVTSALILLPFIDVLIFMVTRLIPGKDSILKYKALQLDPIFIEQAPAIALGQAKDIIVHMGKFSIKGLEESLEFIKTNQQKYADRATQMEDTLDSLDHKITDYLIALSSSSLSEYESEEQNKLMKTVTDIERIGDHFENIIELTEYQILMQVNMTESAITHLHEIFHLTISNVKYAITTLDQNDKDLAKKVIENEILIDKMERQLRKEHILRLTVGECTPQAGIIYIDMISNLERIADHAANIANSVLGEQYSFKEFS